MVSDINIIEIQYLAVFGAVDEPLAPVCCSTFRQIGLYVWYSAK